MYLCVCNDVVQLYRLKKCQQCVVRDATLLSCTADDFVLSASVSIIRQAEMWKCSRKIFGKKGYCAHCAVRP